MILKSLSIDNYDFTNNCLHNNRNSNQKQTNNNNNNNNIIFEDAKSNDNS